LAPRVGSDWEGYIGHPKIPLEPKQGMRGEMRGPGNGGGMEGGHLAEGAAPGGDFGAAGEEDGEEAITFDRAAPRRARVVKEEDPAEARKRQEVVGVVGQKTVKGIDNLLFRFCDFTVKPGKQYVYRVRLGVSNPNRGLPVKYLKRPELADQKPRITPWSDPSPIATIPYGEKMLAGKVIPSASSVKEPEAIIRIIQVNEELGAQVPLEKEVSRGTLANFKQVDFRYPDYANGIVGEGTGDFITNTLILDMRGGQPIFGAREKDMTQPGEVLALSRTGELVAMNEFDGEDTWTAHAPPEKKAETKAPGGDFMDGPGTPSATRPMRKSPKAIRGGANKFDILREPPTPRPKKSSRSN
jgi:hypothetical protein